MKNLYMVFHEGAVKAHVLFVPVLKLLATRGGLEDIVILDFCERMAHAVEALYAGIGL